MAAFKRMDCQTVKVEKIDKVAEKMSRVTSIDLSLFKGFPFPLLLSPLPFMTSHGSFFRHFVES